MVYDGWSFWGMHFFWWVFLIAVITGVVAILVQGADRGPRRREKPLEILQRRYAAGEISSEEYEERKARLERDAKLTE
jgi:putative membrane protein